MSVIDSTLRAAQRRVRRGIFVGLSALSVALWWLGHALPAPSPEPEARLRYVANLLVLVMMPMLGMVITVANGRFRSAAIDPLRGAETPRIVVDGRVLDNTVQQTLLFVVLVAAVATGLTAGQLPWLAAASVCFVAARLAFWVGYRIDPLLRAPGMAATAWLNIGLAVVALARMP